MIVGSVNADYEPIIRLSVCGADSQVYEQTAIVDTGFNGWVSLPPGFITLPIPPTNDGILIWV